MFAKLACFVVTVWANLIKSEWLNNDLNICVTYDNKVFFFLLTLLFKFSAKQDSWEDDEEKKDEEKVEVKAVKTKPKKSLIEKIAEKEVRWNAFALTSIVTQPLS